MATEIATWYEVNFTEDSEGNVTSSQTIIGTGTALNFAGVEAGSQSVIKCIRIRFSRKIAGLKFWLVNNISGVATAGGVFDDGWAHGYHIRSGETETVGEQTYTSPLLNANNPSLFNSSYYKSDEAVAGKLPFGYEENKNNEISTDDPSSIHNYNSFVKIPRGTQFFTENPNYYQWGENNTNGNFGTDVTNTPADDPVWYTPYIYLVVNPPLSADGGARTGWGYRISFLYS